MEKLYGICIDDIESLNIGFKNRIEVESSFYGATFGIPLGRVEEKNNKTVYISYIKEDKEKGNIDILEKILNTCHICKHLQLVCNSDESLSPIDNLYLMYEIENHSSKEKTVMDKIVNDALSDTICNITVEFLFVTKDKFSRYVTIDFVTKDRGILFLVNKAERIFEQYYINGVEGFEYKNNSITIKFYNEIGESVSVEIENISQLLNMANSVRVIKCEEYYCV